MYERKLNGHTAGVPNDPLGTGKALKRPVEQIKHFFVRPFGRDVKLHDGVNIETIVPVPLIIVAEMATEP